MPITKLTRINVVFFYYSSLKKVIHSIRSEGVELGSHLRDSMIEMYEWAFMSSESKASVSMRKDEKSIYFELTSPELEDTLIIGKNDSADNIGKALSDFCNKNYLPKIKENQGNVIEGLFKFEVFFDEKVELEIDWDDEGQALKNLHIDDFEKVSDRLKGNKEFAMKAIKKNYLFFEYISDELKSDKELVLYAVGIQGNIIDWAANKFLDDEEVISAAIENNFRAYTFASKRVQEIPHIKKRYEQIKLFSD